MVHNVVDSEYSFVKWNWCGYVGNKTIWLWNTLTVMAGCLRYFIFVYICSENVFVWLYHDGSAVGIHKVIQKLICLKQPNIVKNATELSKIFNDSLKEHIIRHKMIQQSYNIWSRYFRGVNLYLWCLIGLVWNWSVRHFCMECLCSLVSFDIFTPRALRS